MAFKKAVQSDDRLSFAELPLLGLLYLSFLKIKRYNVSRPWVVLLNIKSCLIYLKNSIKENRGQNPRYTQRFNFLYLLKIF